MSKARDIREVIQKFRELTYHIENNHHTEQKLLTEGIAKIKGLEKLELTLTEYHIIAHIGDAGSANGTALSKALNLSNAGVYKGTKKLLKKKLIAAVKRPDNKKEVHYTLNEAGLSVYELHKEMHGLAEERFKNYLKKYEVKELSVIIKFLEDFDSLSE